MDILITLINGVPMVSTVTIAAVCRKGKSNNVYRMAKRLAEMGEPGIITHDEKPAYCMVSQSAFGKLATRFYRHRDEATVNGVVAINNAFEQFIVNTIIDNEISPLSKAVTTAEKSFNQATGSMFAPLANDIANGVYNQFLNGLKDKIATDNAVEKKMGIRIANYIEETKKRIDVMFDALMDVVLDMMGDVNQAKIEAYNAGVASKISECDALRSELVALRRMIQPEPKPAAVQTLNGNVSVQQCSAWLTSNGIKDMGEIRLYDWMRKNGLVCAVGTSRNLPTQIALEKGLLVTERNPYRHPHTGELVNSFTTRVTPKGQAYLYNRLMYYQINPKK